MELTDSDEGASLRRMVKRHRAIQCLVHKYSAAGVPIPDSLKSLLEDVANEAQSDQVPKRLFESVMRAARVTLREMSPTQTETET